MIKRYETCRRSKYVESNDPQAVEGGKDLQRDYAKTDKSKLLQNHAFQPVLSKPMITAPLSEEACTTSIPKQLGIVTLDRRICTAVPCFGPN